MPNHKSCSVQYGYWRVQLKIQYYRMAPNDRDRKKLQTSASKYDRMEVRYAYKQYCTVLYRDRARYVGERAGQRDMESAAKHRETRTTNRPTDHSANGVRK